MEQASPAPSMESALTQDEQRGRQYLEHLGRRLEHALAGRRLDELLPRSKGITGLDASARLLMEMAQSAMTKLKAQQQPLPAEVEVLELALRLARPAPQVVEGRLPEHVAPRTLTWAPSVQAAIEAMLPGVALIELAGEGIATGFQVGPRALATNRHVLQCLLQYDALARGLAKAHFCAEGPGSQDAVLRITRVLASHETEDVALCELEGPGPLEQGLPLARAPGLGQGAEVLVIGFPTRPPSQPYFVEALFGRRFSVKRASPGQVLAHHENRLLHDCSTLQGSSGSPVIDCRTGQVVAIHASVVPTHWNTAVSTSALYAEGAFREQVTRWE